MTLWKQTRKINIAIPEELLANIDYAANEKYMSRSEYIRQILNQEIMNNPPKTPFNNKVKAIDSKWLATDDS